MMGLQGGRGFSLLYLFFWPHRAACGILITQLGIKPGSPAAEAQSPNHWTPSWNSLDRVLKGICSFQITCLRSNLTVLGTVFNFSILTSNWIMVSYQGTLY